jgi:hypothetical protein
MSGKRAALTCQQVREIFHWRVPASDLFGSSTHFTVSSRSVEVSRRFGVSPKAVRDIWNRRTWCRVTSTRPDSQAIRHDKSFFTVHVTAGSHRASHTKKVGRPLDSKDSRPRLRRLYGVSAQADRRVPAELMHPSLPETDQSRCCSSDYLSAPTCGVSPPRERSWYSTEPSSIQDSLPGTDWSRRSTLEHRSCSAAFGVSSVAAAQTAGYPLGCCSDPFGTGIGEFSTETPAYICGGHAQELDAPDRTYPFFLHL